MTRALGLRGGCPQARRSCLPPTQGRLHSASIEGALGAVLAPRGPPQLRATGPPSACPGVLPVPFPGTLGESPAEELVLGGNRSLEVTATHKLPSRLRQPRGRRPPPRGHTRPAQGPAGVQAVSVPGQEHRGNFPEHQTRQMATDETDGFWNCRARGPGLCQPLPRWAASSGQAGGRGAAPQNLPEPLSVLPRG